MVVAPATPRGHSALAVVRLSGTGCHDVVRRIARPLRGVGLAAGPPRRVVLSDDRGDLDDGVAWLVRGPSTTTGEDTAELTVHGNPLIVDRVVRAAVDAGARIAEGGEFTRRALEHGKLDLVRAEAVAQAIDASTRAGLVVARAGLDGSLSAYIAGLRATVVGLTAELEARLDWPGDDLAHLDDAALVQRLQAVSGSLAGLAATWSAGNARVHGARVALVGPVNAGKSSLFNALLGRTRALVHASPGTTRDVVEAPLDLGDLRVTLLDTAGERPTDDPVEAAGLALARELAGEADLLLLVVPAWRDDPVVPELLERTSGRRRLTVWSGVDLPHRAPVPAGVLETSSRTGQGLDALREALRRELAVPTQAGTLVVASARQRDRLHAAAVALQEAAGVLAFAGPAVAADASTRALEELDALTGADTREDVLDQVFAAFCIGK